MARVFYGILLGFESIPRDILYHVTYAASARPAGAPHDDDALLLRRGRGAAPGRRRFIGEFARAAQPRPHDVAADPSAAGDDGLLLALARRRPGALSYRSLRGLPDVRAAPGDLSLNMGDPPRDLYLRRTGQARQEAGFPPL